MAKYDTSRHEAVLFDLDGVLTKTAKLHGAAWKKMFDEFLRQWAAEHGEEFVPFDTVSDYKQYVDGKLRYDGVRGFLASRSIELPDGDPTDPPERETVCGLGNRKNAAVVELIQTQGVEVLPSTVEYARQLHEAGVKTAVVSASKNCEMVLKSAGIEHLFDLRIDGVAAGERKLKGKPAPDTFLEAARELGADPAKTVVIEDAVSGVQAGRAGGFGLVIGLGPAEHHEALRKNGADLVVEDLSELAD